eukprot:PITA_30683
MFLPFKAFVDKQFGHQILKLRSDNGGEYVNKKFIKFCTKNEIQMQHIVPYTPQQNGVDERKNHTLKEMDNCILESKGHILNFWAEEINCSNYIVNQTPIKALKNISPKEAWSSIKPDVSHFRVFGSEAWAHNTDDKHKALEPKSEKCIFVGYSEDVKGYRLIPFKSKNVINRRDVKFAENILTYEPSLMDVPPLSIPSTSENISSSDDDSEDENPPPPSQDPPSAPQLPKWVYATQDVAGALASDPTDMQHTHSQFDRASSLLAQDLENYDPDSFAEASGHLDWDVAMNEEYRSLLANDTRDFFPLPKGRKLLRCKWVYRTKYGTDGKFDKHKACLVAKGFSQVEGIDYTETFSPVAKMNSIHIVLSLATSFKWEFHQMDVKSAFLHGDLHHEEIYIEQPAGFIQKDSSLVCWLKKSLYGLKQAPHAWYAKMDSFLLDTGFSKCHFDNTVYTKKVGKSLIILVIYVDDLILTGIDSNLINHVKSSLKKKFEMTSLGHLHYFLGLQVLQSKEGKILYLTHTRPDLSFAVGLISRFMKNPHESHWKATKRILHYVRGTVQFGIHYNAEESPLLVGFIDSDWAGDLDDQKSTASYVFALGSGSITWACKKQSATSLSSVEAEYRGVVEVSKEALWLRQILPEFGFQQQHPTTFWCDNQSSIQLCKDLVQHQCNKHIELHMQFIRNLIHDHVLEVQYCSIDDQVVDIFTKALTEAKFTKL